MMLMVLCSVVQLQKQLENVEAEIEAITYVYRPEKLIMEMLRLRYTDGRALRISL